MSSVIAAEDGVLNEYEALRATKIARNISIMRALGLGSPKRFVFPHHKGHLVIKILDP
jgi:hypothetical protein